MIEVLNLSKTFILPLLMDNFSVHKKSLVNSYIYHIDYPDYNEKKVKGLFILVSYMYSGKADFQYIVDCKEIINIDSNHFMIYVETDLSDKLSDIDLILQGKYSEISFLGKKCIKDYWSLKNDNKVVKVLLKDPTLRDELQENLDVVLPKDAELGNMLNLHNEVFSNKLIKQTI